MKTPGNNFGLGTRDMGKAAPFAMRRLVTERLASYSTAATVSDRFQRFCTYCKDTRGPRRLEQISREYVIEYGRSLANHVSDGTMSPAYAQNLVSAINTVLTAATYGKWNSVSPTRDCAITRRVRLRKKPSAASNRKLVEQAIEQLSIRGQVIVMLCRELGLRSKEAALLDATCTLQEAMASGTINIVNGTKGGRLRTLPITSSRQFNALALAADVQGNWRSLIPAHLTWSQFRDGELRRIREIVKSAGMTGLHDLRAGYAADRYHQLTGERPPIEGGCASSEIDTEARLILAAELGHGRIDIVSAYVGGRR